MNAPAVTRQLLPFREEVGEDEHVRLIEDQRTALILHGGHVSVLDLLERSVEREVLACAREVKDEAALVPSGGDSPLEDGSEVVAAAGLLHRVGDLVRHEVPGKPCFPGIAYGVVEPVNGARVRLVLNKLEHILLPGAIRGSHVRRLSRTGAPEGRDAESVAGLLAVVQESILQRSRVPYSPHAGHDEEILIFGIFLAKVLRAVVPVGGRLHRTEVRVGVAIATVPVEAAAVACLESFSKVDEHMSVLEGHTSGESSLVSAASELELESGTVRYHLDKGFLIDVNVGVGQKKFLTLKVELRCAAGFYRGR